MEVNVNNTRKKHIHIYVKIIIVLLLILLLCMYILSHRIEKIDAVRTIVSIQSSEGIKIIQDNKGWEKVQSDKIHSDKEQPYQEQEIEEQPSKGIKITQNDIGWEKFQELDIFSNPSFSNKKIVAPGSISTYKFSIQNTTNEDVDINILFTEENIHNINMKYKMKIQNAYINSTQWRNPEEINLYGLMLPKNSELEIGLEWCWVESGNDTQIGKTQSVEYILNVDVQSTYTNEEVNR